VTTGIPALAGAIYAERALLQETPLQDALHTLLLKALSGPKSLLGGAAEPQWARLPLLACASASDRGADAAVPLAVAIELQATAYRLLDDLEDGDSSTFDQWPCSAVICNVATTLLALAQRALLRVPAVIAAILADGWVGVCEGQHRDLTLDLDDSDPLGTALQAAEGKTAAIVAATMEAGALVGGADIALAVRYRRFGHAIGLAGQFANDLVGLAPDQGGATDISRGQYTLPILFALVSAAPALRVCLDTARARGPISPTLHGQALAELAATGAHRYVWLLLEGARRDANTALAEIALCRPVRGTLDRLLVPSAFPAVVTT